MSFAALLGLALGTAAMTVVLSAFAGLEDLIAGQFEDANATLKIEPAIGPSINVSEEDSVFLNGLTADFKGTSIMHIFEKEGAIDVWGKPIHLVYAGSS